MQTLTTGTVVIALAPRVRFPSNLWRAALALPAGALRKRYLRARRSCLLGCEEMHRRSLSAESARAYGPPLSPWDLPAPTRAWVPLRVPACFYVPRPSPPARCARWNAATHRKKESAASGSPAGSASQRSSRSSPFPRFLGPKPGRKLVRRVPPRADMAPRPEGLPAIHPYGHIQRTSNRVGLLAPSNASRDIAGKPERTDFLLFDTHCGKRTRVGIGGLIEVSGST